jgi:hypothetical protein
MPEPHEYRTVRHRGRDLHVAARHYNKRDLFGHYVKPPAAAGHECPHRCCQGKREHPKDARVQFDPRVIRGLTNAELAEELDKYLEFDHTHYKGYTQVTAELDRRDERARNASARKERARDRGRRRSEEHRDEVYRQFWQAENATNGYMLSKEGKKADVDPVSLFTGPESRVKKYASPELYEWFQTHGRPTRASFLGSARERRDYHAGSRLLCARGWLPGGVGSAASGGTRPGRRPNS